MQYNKGGQIEFDPPDQRLVTVHLLRESKKKSSLTFVLYLYMQRNNSVVCTQASQQEGPGLDLLCGVYMLSLRLHGFSMGPPASPTDQKHG